MGQCTSIQTDDQFDFSSGEVVTDGGDMEYINAYSGMATSTSYLGGGKVSGNYGENYASFQCLVAFQSFLPDEDDWYTSESVYLFDGSFDARGKWTRWVQTREGKYAIVFVEDADENTLTMKWVYPYGSFTWQ